jgi:hypothetical protein
LIGDYVVEIIWIVGWFSSMLQVLLRLVHFVFMLLSHPPFAVLKTPQPPFLSFILITLFPVPLRKSMDTWPKRPSETLRERPRFDRCKEQLRWAGAPAWVESDLPKGSDLAVTLRCQCGGNHL